MPVTSFTEEMLEKLQKEIDDVSGRLEDVKKTSVEQMWLNDLDDVEKVL